MLEGLVGIVAFVVLIVLVPRQQGRLGLLEREIGALRAALLPRRKPLRRTSAAARCAAREVPVVAGATPMQPEAAGTLAATSHCRKRLQRAHDAGIRRKPTARGSGPCERGADASADARAQAAPKRPDIETALGTRWAVWVGGLALALGGLFLVRYSIEAGIFGPGVRLTMAALLGLVLVGGGEFIRRTGFRVPVEGAAGAYVPGILTAAGAFTLFGTVYAAHGIYGFIGPGAAFSLLGVIGIGTIAAGARAWPGAGRHRPARLDGHAGPRLVAVAERLGAVRLSGRSCWSPTRRSHGCAAGCSWLPPALPASASGACSI